MVYSYICNRNQYYTGSPKNAKPVVTISRAEGSWQRCHPIVAVMQPRMYYIRVGHKPFNAEWSKHRNNMKIELTDKQAQVLYYVLDRANKCFEKDTYLVVHFTMIMEVFFANLNQARNVHLIEL